MINYIIKLFSTQKVKSLSINEDKNNFYYLNDPTTPDLKSKVLISKHPRYMPFNVKNFNPRDYDLIREKDYKNLNCHFVICNLLNYYQTILNNIDGKNLKPWFNNNPLLVDPFAGIGLNAYYDRKSLIFLYKNSLFKKRVVYTCDSVDIVSHELGHAILDSLRPDFWNMQSLEIWSFHEAFADISAFINVTNSDIIIEKMFEETNFDLKKSNIASRIGEDLASSILETRNQLRDLTEEVVYSSFNKTNNPHEYGRIFSCCWYLTLVEIYNFEINNGIVPINAFKIAKEECYSSLIKSIKVAPCHKDFFNIISKIFILNIKEKYKELAQNSFEKRRLIKAQIKYLSNKKVDSLFFNKKDQVLKNKNEMFVLKKHKIKQKLQALSSNESNIEMDIPFDSFFYIKDNLIVEEFVSDEEESLSSAKICESYIKEINYKNWKIENNFLNRVLID